jgi:uncharacterized protein YukE
MRVHKAFGFEKGRIKMAGSVIGAEIPALQHLHVAFTQQSGTVDDLLATLNAEVGATWWQGGAADRFRAAWESDFQPALRRLSMALLDASGEVRNRADALVQVGS